MKKTIIVLLCIVLVLSLVVAGRLVYPHSIKNDAAQWEEQYNLGVRYLCEETSQSGKIHGLCGSISRRRF